ncbi:MAG: glutathione S-transferase family protein [Symploca sp. SIO1C2]|nr:glutathione S-transferase family protein [Symploca sp. SIO1C2]
MKFYYHPISGNARRVWIALLEKQIPFEPILLKLDGDQFQPEFVAINPFHHIPVIVDDGFEVVESLAILDYLEAQYPTPSLMPQEAKALATVRMVELVTINELVPATVPLMQQMLQLPVTTEKIETAQQRIANVLSFFENKLSNTPYFVGENLTLADIVAGSSSLFLSFMGIPVDSYPKVKTWLEQLMQRESFVKTAPTPEEIEAAKPMAKKQLEKL